MRSKDVFSYLESAGLSQSDLARMIGVTRGRITQLKYSDFVTEKLAYRIQDATKGKLKVDRSVYRQVSPRNRAA